MFIRMFFLKFIALQKRGFDLKSNFHIIFKTYKDKKTGKYPQGKTLPDNYETIRNENSIYGQKPISIDDFNDIEKSEIEECVKKEKKNIEVAEKNKLLKKKKKQEEFKENEAAYWKRLGELNQQFNANKKAKKEAKKMSQTIIKM